MNEYGLKPSSSCPCPPEALPTWSSASPDSPARQMDLSRPMFRAPIDVPVAEFLQAIPKVKGAPVISKLDTTGATSLYVEIQYADLDDPLVASPIYTGTLPTMDPLAVPVAANTPKEIFLTRMGYFVPALKIDSTAVAWSATGNPSANRLPVAVNNLSAWLDYYLARGTAAPEFLGLVERATDLDRLETPGTPISSEDAARRVVTAINPRDRGAGASADCFIANDRMVRSLMAAAGGLTGSSGWRMDARTGLNVYHYAGLPVYRCNLPDIDTDPATVGYLFAANLGRDGVCLVHAYGTADTLGIQVDEESSAPQQGQVRYVVHGAWTLMVFDPGAIMGYGNVLYTVE